MANGILSDDCLDRAENAYRESLELRENAYACWRSLQKEYGNLDERTRRAYSLYLSRCIELRRNKRWLNACSSIQQLSGSR